MPFGDIVEERRALLSELAYGAFCGAELAGVEKREAVVVAQTVGRVDRTQGAGIEGVPAPIDLALIEVAGEAR